MLVAFFVPVVDFESTYQDINRSQWGESHITCAQRCIPQRRKHKPLVLSKSTFCMQYTRAWSKSPTALLIGSIGSV